MQKRMVLIALWVCFIMGILLAAHTVSFAGCIEDCKKGCCGDEGICSSESENACVSNCTKDCN